MTTFIIIIISSSSSSSRIFSRWLEIWGKHLL